MSKYFKQLATLISVSLAHNTSANSIPIEKPDNKIDSGKISVADLNVTVSKHLAAHRSHSSHGSHRSHRSSSGGGYRAPATPSVPSTPSRKSEPLGQEPRPKSSYPSNTQSKSLTNTEKRPAEGILRSPPTKWRCPGRVSCRYLRWRDPHRATTPPGSDAGQG